MNNKRKLKVRGAMFYTDKMYVPEVDDDEANDQRNLKQKTMISQLVISLLVLLWDNNNYHLHNSATSYS